MPAQTPPTDWLDALTPPARTAVELLALWPEGVTALGIGELMTAARLADGQRRLDSRSLRELVAGLREHTLLDPRNGRLQWRDQARRGQALQSLRKRGLAAQLGEAAADVLRRLPDGHYGYQFDDSHRTLLRAAIIAGLSEARLRSAFGHRLQFGAEPQDSSIELVMSGTPLDWLDASLRRHVLQALLAASLRLPHADAPAWIEQARATAADALMPWLADHALLRDDHEALPRQGPAGELFDAAARALAGGPAAEVLVGFESAIDHWPRERGRRRPIPNGLPGLLYGLALAATEPPPQRRLKQVLTQRERGPRDVGSQSLEILGEWLEARAGGTAWRSDDSAEDAAAAWTTAVLHRWTGRAATPALADHLRAWSASMRRAGWQRWADDVDALLDERPGTGIAAWLSPEPAWLGVVRCLEQLAQPHAASAPSSGSRLKAVLALPHGGRDRVVLDVFEQRPAKKGGWTTGRAIASWGDNAGVIERLADGDDFDRRLLQAWQVGARRYGNLLDVDHPAIAALIGHPRVFLRSGESEVHVEVERRTPKLEIERLDDGRLRLALRPPPPEEGHRRLQRDGERLLVTDYDDGHLRLQNALAEQHELPADALPQVVALAPALSSRVELATAFGAAETRVDVDSRMHVLVEPLPEGLRFSLRVRPLGASGGYVVPALGPREVIGLVDGLPARGQRQFDDERAAMASLLDACPLLAGAEHGEPVDIPDPEAALELLAALTDLGEAIELAWPEGRAWKLGRARGARPLTLQLATGRDWFDARGGVALDDGGVVQLATLLEHLPSSQSRFVRLADDRVIALSQELARQLRLLRALGEVDRRGVRIPKLAAGLMQPLLDAVDDAELDRGFRQQLARIEESHDIDPAVPAGFGAELRDYQRDGYRWLMQRAAWGAGALLADDMGLGKTVQALAVLAARAGEGPALVVAPTSVIGNWANEARRFAPMLELRQYGDGDRVAALENLGPSQLLLVSYGLLAGNADAFAQIAFATVVLDEAQAIKNPVTQRAIAARGLQAGFRIAMTGTPIENHLGELWSLMRVLNPGLLGSAERFRQRFVLPIERDPRAPERDLLRRLVAPFLLRRLKAQVLDELPPRTEIVLTVQPSADEAKLLAALRRQAISRLAAQSGPTEAKRFHVLAELTRLRRAACHPTLVAPELELASSKLDQLLELVRELADNRHRALVFSQFTDYLALVRQALDAAGISYQYLDGSTPPKQRDAAVAAFQAGAGDLFLLSLKAGGVGLNLTAADYVIHLDPWWNPAVEQQATDRAHRIGQTRPVTVYKLVVAGSIEEQILAMHGAKRELVDAVLEDQGEAARIGVEDLMALLDGV